MLPEQLNIIVDRLLMDISDSTEVPKEIDFTQFRKFLDQNPAIRQVVKDAMKPNLWTIEGGPTASTGGGGNLACCAAPTRKPKKLGAPVDRKAAYTSNAKRPFPQMEGELLKVGKRSESFVPRYYILRDSALIAFKDALSSTPTGKNH
jgi:hypothetical protein